MTTPTGPIVDISLNAPKATFAIALDETEIPYKLDYPEIAKWALGLRATDPYAEFSSEAWFAESIGDEFYLYCNDKLVSKGSITTKATRYFLKVLLNDLPEGLVNVYWEVERRTGQKSRSTTETYLVMKTHPAGIDRRPDIFGHDGLRVVAEGFSAESDIDENTAARGMWALVDKYLNARENDEIFVYLDGVPTKHRLSATEARGAGPYRVFIPPTVFKKISQSGPIALICTVLDVAGNTPEGNDKFSPPFMLNSNADPLLFDPPLLYVKDIESIVFDLGTQSNLPLSVLATPRRTVGFPSPPNQIVVTLTWFRPDGTTIRASKSLPPFAHTQRAGDKTPVPDDYFQEEGFVRMSFVLLTPTGVLLGRSGSSTVRVGGTRVLTYPAPAFDNKPGPQTITLQNYPNGADVTVAYRSMSTNDVIRLNLTTPNGTVVTLGLKSGINGGTVIFRIDAQTLAQSAGQVIKLSYEVTVGGKTTKSDVQELTFQAATISPGVFATVAVGLNAHDVRITKDGLLAYVGNTLDHTVSVIDIKSRKVVDTIFGTPSAFQLLLNADNSRLYVSSFRSGTIAVIDTATRRLILTMTPQGGERTAWMALNADESRLFVACTYGGFVAVHDAKTGAVLNRITTPPLPEGVTLNPEKTQIFISTSKETVITNANGLGGGMARVAGNTQSEGIAFNPNNKPYPRAYVTGVDSLAIIDTQTNVVTKRLSGFTYAWGAAMNPRAPECYVGAVGPGGTPGNRDSLYIINTETEQVIRRYAGFDNIGGIAFTPNGELALMVNHGTGIVSFFKT